MKTKAESLHPTLKRRYTVLVCLAILILGLALLVEGKDPKLTPELLITKHLASLGTPEARGAVKTRISGGRGRMEIIQGGNGSLSGESIYLSEGRKLRMRMQFNHPDYSADDFLYDGDNKIDISQPTPGQRSPLGEFVFRSKHIITEGLLSGVLSTNWALANVEKRNPKLKYLGMKKFGGQKFHALKYQTRKRGGDVKITLYFDPENFRHIYTLYKISISGGMGTTPETSTQARYKVRINLTESFSNFQEVDGLMLPATWTLRISEQTGQGSMIREWTNRFTQFSHNQDIDPQYFAGIM